MVFREAVKGKNVLYVTTHRISYIRCTQELEIIRQEAASVKALYGNKDNHILSAIKIWAWLLTHSTRNFDVVVVSYMCQLIVPFMAWRFRGDLIVDFFISLYDALVFDRKKIREGTAASKIIHRLDERSIDKAALVIADTKTHGQYFREEFGLPSEKMEIMYLKADENIYHPMSVERPKEWENKYLVVYFGTVIPLQGFETVLEAVSILKDDPDIHFLIIGPIPAEKKREDLNNVTYVKWVEQSELAKYIAMSDLCLAGHFNGQIQKADRTIPTKAYIYESMNKPMVLGDSRANHELFVEDKNHCFVKMGDSKQLAQKILEKKRLDHNV